MAKLKLEKYKTLAERYTKALLNIAKEKNITDKISTDLNEVTKVFNENEDINMFFTSPIVKKEDKKDILEKAFKEKIDENLYRFLNVLTNKNRIFILPEINCLYNKHILEENNILEVEAQTVISLDDNMKNLLIQKLEKITNKKIQLTNTINKEIIGGVVLIFNGNVIDGSIKTQLKELQKQLV